MKLLFDSHAFIWWDENPAHLGAAARAACFDQKNDLVLSVASVWEMQIKVMFKVLPILWTGIYVN
jgi:PIN domain nuclease of toxin-antitoxin system